MKTRVLITLVVFVLLIPACGPSTTEKLASALPTAGATATSISASEANQPTSTSAPTSTEAPPLPTSSAAATSAPEATATMLPPTETLAPTTAATATSTPAPTATPTEQPDSLEVSAYGFGQDEREVGFAFVVENPNSNLAVEGTQFQIAAYDKAGTVVKTDSGYIELVLPQQSLGVADTSYVSDGVEVAKIEVQLSPGRFIPSEWMPSFDVERVVYYPGTYGDSIAGILRNPYAVNVSDVRVSAVAYDEGDKVVGSGYTYLNFVLAETATGVSSSIVCSAPPARVEMYASMSSLSDLSSDSDKPAAAEALKLIKYGFGQDDNDLGCGLIVQNPNGGFAVESSQYHVTAYDVDGNVLDTEEGYVEVILPEQTLGLGEKIMLDESMQAESIEVQILAGDYEPSGPIAPFTSRNATYIASKWSTDVTGVIENPYERNIDDIRVSVIAYGSDDQIILPAGKPLCLG